MTNQKINLRKLLVTTLPKIHKLEDRYRLFDFINRCGDELIFEVDLDQVIIGQVEQQNAAGQDQIG